MLIIHYGIIHLAAAVPHSPQYPDNEESANLTRQIDQSVFDAAQAWGCRVVYSSGCSLYGSKSENYYDESQATVSDHDSPYLLAKNQGEKLFSYSRGNVVLRISAPVGPGLPQKVVLMKFLNQALLSQPIEIWGTGKREQNYVDVRDIASALKIALTLTKGGIYNISANVPTTMLELAKTIIKVLGFGEWQFVNKPDPQERERARYSNSNARKELGWQPKITLKKSIRDIVAR